MSIHPGARIAFLGAGGTGKTTTAKYLSEQTEIPLIRSAARVVYEDKGLTEDDVGRMSTLEKFALQHLIFDQKITNDKQHSYIADRTLLDHYCYFLAYCGSGMSNKDFLEFEEQTRMRMLSTYSHIFYFPWGYWDPKPDKVRSDSMAWQSQIDAMMTGYVSRWGLDVITVPQSNEADRNEFVFDFVDGYNNKQEY